MDSGLTEFFQQIPAPLIAMFCVSALLLVAVGGYIIWSRSQRRQAELVAAVAAARMPAHGLDLADLGDMPDLDSLTTSAPPVEALPRPTGTQRIQLTDGDSIDVVEVLTILRDVADGSLIVQIGERVYRNPPTAADAEFKRRFNLTMKELANGKRATSESAAVHAPSDPPISAAPAAPPMPKVAATGEMPSVPYGVPLPGDLPKFKMPDNPEIPSRRNRKAPPKEVIPEINIAAAIESFLQHKLATTPSYAGRNIHVRPAAHGGVEIDVEGQLYEAVGDIEDVDVRQFLTAIIAEWQSRQ